MLKALYHAFILMLVIQLTSEEYTRARNIVRFIRKIGVSVRVKGKEDIDEIEV